MKKKIIPIPAPNTSRKQYPTKDFAQHIARAEAQYHIFGMEISMIEAKINEKKLVCRVFNLVISYCCLPSQINILATCKLHSTFHITDLLNIDFKYKVRLCDSILQQDKFLHIKKLDASYNLSITNIYFMTNLSELDASGLCGITQDAIIYANLSKLIADYNVAITDVSFMNKLRVLHAKYNCGIDQAGIHGLDLIELDASHNQKITNVTSMNNLHTVRKYGNCGINANRIKN